jgi:hypothetical protein
MDVGRRSTLIDLMSCSLLICIDVFDPAAIETQLRVLHPFPSYGFQSSFGFGVELVMGIFVLHHAFFSFLALVPLRLFSVPNPLNGTSVSVFPGTLIRAFLFLAL